MAYVPNSGSVVAFQSNPANLHASVTGTVTVRNSPSIYGNISGSVVSFQGTVPWIVTGSVQASLTPAANQSVSGTVGASIIGLAPVSVSNFPITQNVSGSVVATQGTTPWIITGSVQASLTPAANQSVSGTVGASLIGLSPVSISNFPITQNISGSVAAFLQSTNASVITVGSPVANQSVSGTVGASIIGLTPVSVSNFPASQNVSGSVVAFQGTTPWVTNFQNSSILAVPVGSVITVFQNPSIVGTYAEDTGFTNADNGLFVLGVRNDTVASISGTNLDYTPYATDSAGRILNKPYAAEEARVEGYHSVVTTSVTTLVAAAGAGLRNYITDVWFANTGASTTLVTLRSQGGTSILGYTIVPAGGGSNLPGLQTPIRTGVNETFDFQATTATSVLFATVKGFKAP